MALRRGGRVALMFYLARSSVSQAPQLAGCAVTAVSDSESGCISQVPLDIVDLSSRRSVHRDRALETDTAGAFRVFSKILISRDALPASSSLAHIQLPTFCRYMHGLPLLSSVVVAFAS